MLLLFRVIKNAFGSICYCIEWVDLIALPLDFKDFWISTMLKTDGLYALDELFFKLLWRDYNGISPIPLFFEPVCLTIFFREMSLSSGTS